MSQRSPEEDRGCAAPLSNSAGPGRILLSSPAAAVSPRVAPISAIQPAKACAGSELWPNGFEALSAVRYARPRSVSPTISVEPRREPPPSTEFPRDMPSTVHAKRPHRKGQASSCEPLRLASLFFLPTRQVFPLTLSDLATQRRCRRWSRNWKRTSAARWTPWAGPWTTCSCAARFNVRCCAPRRTFRTAPL